MTDQKFPSDPKRAAINRRNASKPRVSKALRHAIHLMAAEGLPHDKAAEEAGMRPHSLYKALRKTHVKALLAEEHRSLRNAEAFRAYAKMARLSDDARSEDVKFRATAWIAGVDGLAPAQKVAIDAQHVHRFEGIAFAEPPAEIDGQAEHVQDAETVEEGEDG